MDHTTDMGDMAPRFTWNRLATLQGMDVIALAAKLASFACSLSAVWLSVMIATDRTKGQFLQSDMYGVKQIYHMSRYEIIKMLYGPKHMVDQGTASQAKKESIMIMLVASSSILQLFS